MSNTAALACSGGMIRLEEPLDRCRGGLDRGAWLTHAHLPQEPSPTLGVRQKLVRTLAPKPSVAPPQTGHSQCAPRSISPTDRIQYLPQLQHFLALLRAGARESDVVPLELSLDIQRVIDRARADQRR